MNTRAFVIAVVIIVLAIVAFVVYKSRQPLEPEGSLKNVEISPTPIGDIGPTISQKIQNLPY